MSRIKRISPVHGHAGFVHSLLLFLYALEFVVSTAREDITGIKFRLTHKYAHLPGSSHRPSFGDSAANGFMSVDHFFMLRKHDRDRQKTFNRTTRGRFLAGDDEEGHLPMSEKMKSPQARDEDLELVARERFLAEKGSGADFQLWGNADRQVAGLYWTTIGLGSPPVEYKVQIDTGSDLLWVQCEPCTSCPKDSDIVDLSPPFNPGASSTSKSSSCESSMCSDLQETQSALGPGCSTRNTSDNSCYYKLQYGDGSTTTGYLVSDQMEYMALSGNTTTSHVAFGCSFNQSGPLLSSIRVVDGLMGLGMGALSIPSQLTQEGVIANSFAHCLGGEANGGGSLVLGTVVAEGAVFTPIEVGRPQYYVTLNSVTVGSTRLSGISASTFGTSRTNEGVIFDSGTTLAIVPDALYNALIAELNTVVKDLDQVKFNQWPDEYCWDYTGKALSALPKYFPNLTLSFENATMNLEPENYMSVLSVTTISQAVCLSWQSTGTSGVPLTLFGDMVMRNKLVIYDEGNQRIGWVKADCTSGTIRTQNVTIVTAYRNSAAFTALPIRHLALYVALALLGCLVWGS